MKADRYLLPILPVLLLFAATALDGIPRLPAIAEGKRRIAAAALLFLAAAVPLAAHYTAHTRRYEPDSRTLAREWLEANVPSGAFIVSESYGPELMGPQMLLSLDKGIRTRLLERTADRPQYAVQPIPMMQVYPELTEVFYDLRLYADADVIITSSAVASRYRNEPKRFPGHIAFYEGLEEFFMVIGQFEGGTGPRVTFYKTRERKAPFAGRNDIVGPRALQPAKLSGSEALFYSNLGANYEAFRFYEEANACYDMALGYPLVRPHWFSEIVVGKTRALMALGRAEEAVAFLRAAAERAPSAAMTERVDRLIRSIQDEGGK
jgi:tetratricopeptide (TPR) repeat protein